MNGRGTAGNPVAEKRIDDLGRIDNRTDIETSDATKKENLGVNEAAVSPKVSKAFAESNLI
jgi:hypothetical protein